MPKLEPDKPKPIAITPVKLAARPEVKLAAALAKLLRRLGLIGKVAPGVDGLCRIAIEFAEYRNNTFATDQGEVIELKDVLAKPNKKLDSEIPF